MTRPPLTFIGRSGGWRGSKSLRRINPADWLPRPDQFGIFDSFELTACGNNPVLTPVQRGRHPAQRRHDTVAHSGLGSHCLAACQPTTASATASVDAK